MPSPPSTGSTAPVTYAASSLARNTQAAATADGVVWLSVISSKPGSQGHVDAAAANKLTADRGATPTHVLLDPDGTMGRAYGAKTTPHIYIITPDGKIAYKHVGPITPENLASTIRPAIAAALAR